MYVDVVRTNVTLWNTSVVAGPVAGGTDIKFFGKFGDVVDPRVKSAPETDGLPDYGRPLCVFGRSSAAPRARPADCPRDARAPLWAQAARVPPADEPRR